MESNSKKIIKSTFIYFVGNILSKVIIFFMLPLYTKYISPNSYGYYDSAIAVVTFLTSVLFLDIGSAIMRFMLEKTNYKEKVITSGFCIFLLSFTVYLILAIILGLFIEVEYIWLLIIYGAISTINTLYSFIIRGYGNGSIYAISGIIATIINVLCNLLFILVFKMDYKALYLSSIISLIIQTIIFASKAKLYNKIKITNFDINLFKTILLFCLPLCLNSVAYWGLTSANKLIVTFMIGADANGYLSIANKFTSILYLLSTCFQLAWQELAYSQKNDLSQDTGIFYSNATNLFIKILTLGIILILPIISIIFPILINIQYYSSKILIPIAMLGTIFSILSAFLGTIFSSLKKTSIIFITTLIGAIINIGLCILLIHLGCGVQAANISFLIGYSINVLLRLLLIKKYIKYNINWGYFLILIPCFTIEMLIFTHNWYYNLIIFVFALILAFCLFKKDFMLIIKNLKNKKQLNNMHSTFYINLKIKPNIYKINNKFKIHNKNRE